MPEKKKFTPAGWATELRLRFYRAAMRKAGIGLDDVITEEKFKRAYDEWANVPIPAKILPKPKAVAESMIRRGLANKRVESDEPEKPEPKAESIKAGEK